jgi:flagella basal body P-ring formation protein FlgA
MIASLGLALAVAVAPQCAYVDRDIITGTDLLAADPAFAAIPPDRIVGRSPSPGRQRFFTVPELKAIAESSGLSLVPTQDVCFEWRTSVVSSEAAGAAMAEAYPEARIEVVEMSRYPAPSGSVVFPRASLQRVPAAVMLWRGYVVYGEERRFDIWARVKVYIQTNRVVATELLRPGRLIGPDDVRVDPYNGPPLEPGFAASAAEVIGRVPRSVTPAGSAIKMASLETPAEITRGDVVNVEVINGAARISLEARASTSGRLGQSIQLQNQSSGKTFRATVSGSGRAVLVIGRAR